MADYVYTFGILLNSFTQTLGGFGGLADKRGADYGGFTVYIYIICIIMIILKKIHILYIYIY